MEDQIISFETAKLAKEKGFDFINVHNYYHINEGYSNGYAFCYSEVNKQTNECLLVPTQSLLQKWLREKHNIDVYIHAERYSDSINYCVQAQKWNLVNGDPENNFIVNASYSFNDNGEYLIYELAFEKGLQEALKLI